MHNVSCFGFFGEHPAIFLTFQPATQAHEKFRSDSNSF